MKRLQVTNLHKRFGGISATDAVNLDISPAEIHAVIGPNGAGKSTLIALLAGELRPDDGMIEFDGRPITHLPPYARTRLGLARSFQTTCVFQDMTLLENTALAVQGRPDLGHSFRFWRRADRERRLLDPAHEILDRLQLSGRAQRLAAEVSHGEHRQLEIAMALALRPKLLLLDEPTAGMGAEESARMVALLQSLKGQLPILLVEHDMDAVFALADRISVLVYGRIIATGSPAQVRSDPAVRQAYLGDTVDTGPAVPADDARYAQR